jgi:hypothetical protein
MPAQIIKHATPPQPNDDPDHPIPSLEVIDVMGVKKGGGANLVVVVASPLMGDSRSQARLLEKIQGYLRYIGSNEFRAQAGTPTLDNTTILVKLHPESAPEIRDLLARSREKVLSNNASLIVQSLTHAELGGGT